MHLGQTQFVFTFTIFYVRFFSFSLIHNFLPIFFHSYELGSEYVWKAFLIAYQSN